jgi:DNA-binding NtrC family response regulator
MPDKSVFVVDDDAAVRRGLRFMLRAAGYSVQAFPSARSFLEDYDPPRGGCLFLDVQMPQMTGPELQQQLNVRGWRIPVIFIGISGRPLIRNAAGARGSLNSESKTNPRTEAPERVSGAVRRFRNSGFRLTRRWREVDSNFRFRAAGLR